VLEFEDFELVDPADVRPADGPGVHHPVLDIVDVALDLLDDGPVVGDDLGRWRAAPPTAPGPARQVSVPGWTAVR
jgi:hypothetical protein